MDIIELGAIGEAVGPIAVVGSLIFVGFQIRQNTLTAAGASREAVSGTTHGQLLQIGRDAEVSAFLRSAMTRPNELDEDDQYRFLCLMYALAEGWEASFSQWKRGILSDEDWEKWITIIGTWKSQPGSDLFWTMAEGMFSRAFRDFWRSLQPVHAFSYERPSGSDWNIREGSR